MDNFKFENMSYKNTGYTRSKAELMKKRALCGGDIIRAFNMDMKYMDVNLQVSFPCMLTLKGFLRDF